MSKVQQYDNSSDSEFETNDDNSSDSDFENTDVSSDSESTTTDDISSDEIINKSSSAPERSPISSNLILTPPPPTVYSPIVNSHLEYAKKGPPAQVVTIVLLELTHTSAKEFQKHN